MAGDWIKLEHWTPDKPEVFRMAEILGIDPDAVGGKLNRIWIWADQQTVDGNADVTRVKRECNATSVTKRLIDRLASVTGFADAMIAVGWLEEVDGGVWFVNFDRHNGETAKKRAQTNRRVAKHRGTGNANVTQPALQKAYTSVTKSVTREEKRRDTDNAGALSLGKQKRNRVFVVPTAEEVAAYCRERNNGIDPQSFVDFYSSKGWVVGKSPMKNWQAAVRTWEKNNGTTVTSHRGNAPAGREAERINRSLSAIAKFVDRKTQSGDSLHDRAVRQGDGCAGGGEEDQRTGRDSDRGLVRGPGDVPSEEDQCSDTGDLPF